LGSISNGNADDAWDPVVFKNIFVHSNIGVKGPPELRLDIAALERQARAARSAWIGGKLKSFGRFLLRKFGGVGRADMKNDQAKSASAGDPEHSATAVTGARNRAAPETAQWPRSATHTP